MKKLASLFLALLLVCLLLSSCSGAKPVDSSASAPSTGTLTSNTPAPAKTAPEQPPLTAESLNQNLQTQPLVVTSTSCETQTEDSSLKILYPDMLQAILQNNSGEDIRSAVVAFVAWDENNLPVKIEGQFDFSGGTYIKKVNYDDINLIDGGTFGDGYGYSLGDDCKVKTCKAIAVSYETFEGTTWTNPYFDDFCELYEGKKHS